jgi:hypothetical protein
MRDWLLTLRVCSSWDEWLQALSVRRDTDEQDSLTLPLPPQVDRSCIEHVKKAISILGERGGAHICPVDAVISVGERGETAARLFAWLTGSPVLYPETGDGALDNIVDLCTGKSNVLISCDKDFNQFGLSELSSTLGKLNVNFGFIYPYDTESAVIAAFKAAHDPYPTDSVANYLINPLSWLEVDRVFDNLHLAIGATITTDRMQEILALPANIKMIVAHGNGFDYNLGQTVLCCIDGAIPVIHNPMLFPCFQTGVCLRSSQSRFSMNHIQADFLLMATCWGVFDGAELDYTRTAFSPLVVGSSVWALMTTAGPWTSAPQDWLRIHNALSHSYTHGEAARRLNHLVDPLHATFFLFGNPCAKLCAAPYRRLQLNMSVNVPSPTPELLPGFQLLQIEPSVLSNYAAYVPEGDLNSQLGRAEFAKAEASADGTLIAFCDTRLTIAHAPVEELGPRPGMETYARLTRNVGMVEHLLPAFGQGTNEMTLAGSIANLKRKSVALGRFLENREIGNGHMLLKEEFASIAAIHNEWLSCAQSITSTWLTWSTKGPAAGFIVDIWRPEFRQTSVAEGPRCDVCRKSTRNQFYTCLTTPLPERTLTLCRICSTKSDKPSSFELSIDFQQIIYEKNCFYVYASLGNESDHPSLLCSAMFLMSAYHVWPECISLQSAAWMSIKETAQLDFAIPKPEFTTPGAHWFVMIGLFDGAPFTHCTQIHISRAPG